MNVLDIPQRPNFEELEAAAAKSADRRTMVLALIGNMVFSWSNNESMFVHVLMLLMETDERTAAIVFATLNTTRARLDLVTRLAKIKINDRAIAKELTKIIERFNECTRVRNELTHCMFSLNEEGEITHTQTMRIRDTPHGLDLGSLRRMDDRRLGEMTAVSRQLKFLNRDLWALLPRLQAHLQEPARNAASG